MKISIIIPSYNQPDFIEHTFRNVTALKEELYKMEVDLEVLLFDSCSVEKVRSIIEEHKKLFDYIEIKKDKGQYDAINKGIARLTGDYWTWLNTDDLIEISGCIKIVNALKSNPNIDYIYGNSLIIDENGKPVKNLIADNVTLQSLLNKSTSIVQPGSFFKTSFTRAIGELHNYECCFDYDYVLRIFRNNGCAYLINETVSRFRYYSTSKSGALEMKFVDEKLKIRQSYKTDVINTLTFNLYKQKYKLLIKRMLLISKKIVIGN